MARCFVQGGRLRGINVAGFVSFGVSIVVDEVRYFLPAFSAGFIGIKGQLIPFDGAPKRFNSSIDG